MMIKYAPPEIKNRLFDDFLEKALPEAISRLRPGYSMYVITHLNIESSMDKLPYDLRPECEPYSGIFNIIMTQIVAWLIWVLRTIWRREIYKPTMVLDRSWHKLTWRKNS